MRYRPSRHCQLIGATGQPLVFRSTKPCRSRVDGLGQEESPAEAGLTRATGDYSRGSGASIQPPEWSAAHCHSGNLKPLGQQPGGGVWTRSTRKKPPRSRRRRVGFSPTTGQLPDRKESRLQRDRQGRGEGCPAGPDREAADRSPAPAPDRPQPPAAGQAGNRALEAACGPRDSRSGARLPSLAAASSPRWRRSVRSFLRQEWVLSG